MAYIKKEPIVEFIKKGLNTGALGHDAIEVLAEIAYAPTADVVEVVRCKDCVYCDLDGRCEAPENGLIREYVKPNDFCSYGKREKNDS